ncbi:hypothetical protein DUNSADRAFT_16103 [Dunaliella salina]|uniref:Encoded protein n=1 Tax=Dunaliella salina TaxID=3046 RepID=A0ABQ7G4B8_DUNSA|nr:hypothetical protein DUNSADRAFT_16103 [Dunaliella salina]|eukprot:KAF5829404.1 hypothetical protein DUNSADRAFT_16103 [Dunaliella salina]
MAAGLQSCCFLILKADLGVKRLVKGKPVRLARWQHQQRGGCAVQEPRGAAKYTGKDGAEGVCEWEGGDEGGEVLGIPRMQRFHLFPLCIFRLAQPRVHRGIYYGSLEGLAQGNVSGLCLPADSANNRELCAPPSPPCLRHSCTALSFNLFFFSV